MVGGEHELVDVAVEGRVGQRDEAVEGGDVVVGFRGERGLAEARVGLVVPLEDAGAGEVDVVDGVVGFGDAFGDGFGRGDVVGGFGRVWVAVSGGEGGGGEGGIRRTMSALLDSSSSTASYDLESVP